MKILLTGHKGFLGTLLTKYLNTHGHVVIGLDKKERNNLLTCKLDWDIDIVIHLAGESGVRRSLTQPKIYWENNVLASKRLFDTHKDKKIIYASSSTAKDPARNPYGMTKHLMERIAPQTSLGLRFCTIYSNSQQRPNMFVPRLLRKEIEYIHTNHKRDFIHIDDVCSAITFLMNRDAPGVYDIGTGISTPLKEITDFFDIKCEERIGGENERLCNKADISKLTDFGWSPKIKLFEYLKSQKDLTL